MNDEFIDPLRKFSQQIVPLSSDFPDYLLALLRKHDIKISSKMIEKTFRIGDKVTWIDWEEYPNHYTFCFDFFDNEEPVRKCLRQSKLSSYPYVLVEFGYVAPISKIPIDIFFNYWYELVIIAGYETVVMTEDGVLFMEFIRRDYSLNSNFLIWT